ncbi:MAG: hypothetical protein JJU10_09740 [Idiomarina sp.]|nr:hypothetical protein [Idiomarina sp.]
MLLFVVLAVCSAVFFYIQAHKYAMGPRRWGILGLCFGPLIWPMFRTHQQFRLLKALGPNAVRFHA